jgi:hypothetical protein
MRLLANDLGPAKITFLCYPFPSREVTALLDRLALRSDICGISNYSHATLFQVQFVSSAMTLNNRSADFLAERIRKNASTVRFAAGIYEEVRYAVKSARSLAGFAPRVQARKSL